MRTHRFATLVIAAFGLAILPVVGRAEPAPGPADWSDIKDLTYDTRAQFLAGLKRLEARVDAEFNELTARRAAMKSTVDTKDWDFAMKEMTDARAYLKDTGDELSATTTPGKWAQERDKVGEAWVRTQDAYDKVKSSITD